MVVTIRLVLAESYVSLPLILLRNLLRGPILLGLTRGLAEVISLLRVMIV